MKGPGLRIENDVRRTWRCPSCGRESRAGGDVVSLRCPCTHEGVPMRLLEGRRQVRQFPRPPAPPAERTADEELSRPAETIALVETVVIEAVPAMPDASLADLAEDSPPPDDEKAVAGDAPDDGFGEGLAGPDAPEGTA